MQQVLPYINNSIFHPYLPQPCVATIDVTGDLTWAKSSLKSKDSLKLTSSSSPLLPPGVLADQVDRDCAKILKRLLCHLSCTALSPTVHLRSHNLHQLLKRMGELAMQTTGTDTQGSSWTRPPERRLDDRPNESLIGGGFATWRS